MVHFNLKVLAILIKGGGGGGGGSLEENKMEALSCRKNVLGPHCLTC